MSIKLSVAAPAEGNADQLVGEPASQPLPVATLPALDAAGADEAAATFATGGRGALPPLSAPEPVVPTPAAATVVAKSAASASQALAAREASHPALTKAGITSDDPLVLQAWGEMVVSSNMFPNIHTWQAAVACGKMCQDLRLAPWISMGQFHVIEGKPTLALALILQLVKRAGVKYQFSQDYGYFTHPATGQPDFLTEISFEHPSLIGGTVTYQKWFSECIQAGWTSKQNWQKMPRTMLRARVITEACRLYFPDLLGGSYEFGEMVDAGKIEDHTYAVEI